MKDFAHSIAEQRALDDMVVVDHGTESDNVEAAALRVVLERMRHDLYAMQTAINRITEERDQWRTAYYRLMHENKDEPKWSGISTRTTTTGGSGPSTN